MNDSDYKRHFGAVDSVIHRSHFYVRTQQNQRKAVWKPTFVYCCVWSDLFYAHPFWAHKWHRPRTRDIMPLVIPIPLYYPPVSIPDHDTVFTIKVVWLAICWVPNGPIPRSAIWPLPVFFPFLLICSYPYSCLLLFYQKVLNCLVMYWGKVATFTPTKLFLARR